MARTRVALPAAATSPTASVSWNPGIVLLQPPLVGQVTRSGSGPSQAMVAMGAIGPTQPFRQRATYVDVSSGIVPFYSWSNASHFTATPSESPAGGIRAQVLARGATFVLPSAALSDLVLRYNGSTYPNLVWFALFAEDTYTPYTPDPTVSPWANSWGARTRVAIPYHVSRSSPKPTFGGWLQRGAQVEVLFPGAPVGACVIEAWSDDDTRNAFQPTLVLHATVQPGGGTVVDVP